jgi:hypothetical protein
MACNKCGCVDMRRLANRLFCRHCGHDQPIPIGKDDPSVGRPARPMPQKAGVPYFVLRCPECGGDNIKTLSSPRPIRYHECQNPKCLHRFKSVEQ